MDSIRVAPEREFCCFGRSRSSWAQEWPKLRRSIFLRNLLLARAWTPNPLLFLWPNCVLTKADPNMLVKVLCTAALLKVHVTVHPRCSAASKMFFFRAINLWNSLPQEYKELSYSIFCERIKSELLLSQLTYYRTNQLILSWLCFYMIANMTFPLFITSIT